MQVFRRGAASCGSKLQTRLEPQVKHIISPSRKTAAAFSTHSHAPLRLLPASHRQILRRIHPQFLSRCASTRSPPVITPEDPEDRITKFSKLAERGLVDQGIIDTLTKGMGIEDMTDVQSLTINATLNGVDTVAQARTGTGKTLAFLIPIVQNILANDPTLADHIKSPRGSERLRNIRALVISPTRELAEQIAVEARKLVRNTDISVQTAVGGTGKRQGLQKIQDSCHILVGTPGRLKDILSDPYSKIEAPNLSMLVLDEADRLLEQGFEEEIREIQGLLPDKRMTDRQTLLFSATISRDIMPVIRSTMKRDFQLVKTVGDDEQPTHEKVPQKIANVRRLENVMPALAELCLRETKNSTSERPFKAVIFYPTLNEVMLAAATMQYFRRPARLDPSQPGLASTTEVFELHSDLSQRERSAAADGFRRASSALLVCSDVAARGMDFPGVTHVIQVGLPPSQEQYIHRIGRTARAGKTGEAWLFITDLEGREARDRLPRMPLQPDTSLEAAKLNLERGGLEGQLFLSEELSALYRRIITCNAATPVELRLRAFAGVFNLFSWQRKETVLAAANARATLGLGFDSAPAVPHNVATKLNLFRVPGINIAEPVARSSYGGSPRDGGRQGGYGGPKSYGDRSGGFSSGGDRGRSYGDRSGGDRQDRGRNQGTYQPRGDRRYEPREQRSPYGGRNERSGGDRPNRMRERM